MAVENALALLTRAPAAGGKSRLFAELGIPPDRQLLEALLLDTIDNARIDGAHIVLAVTPAAECEPVRAWLESVSGRAGPGAGLTVMAQPEWTLGDRMRDLLAMLLRQGARRVVLIGSDLPTITPARVRDAFAALERDPQCVVIGPARDGGYYLLAASHVPPLFDGIEWGSSRVLEQTLMAAARSGLRVHLVDALSDVDTPADLLAAAGSPGATRTSAWVRGHLRG